jgi:beta-lactamase superfamily II metal-dependent hydrolase
MSVNRLRLRMYNVGFGDGFLLTADRDDGRWRMLIDCGVHSKGGSSHPMSEIVPRIIDDITPDGGPPRLDVVVATHRHQDHVSGFQSKAWDAVEVGEVWMPFTENPNDSLGRSIRNSQSKRAQDLVARLTTMAAAGDRAAAAAADVAGNSLTNAKAMDRLHHGFRGTPNRRYFPDTDNRQLTFEAPGLPEMTVHMLGPLRDREVIASMDPPAGQDWLRAARPGEEADLSERPLFAPAFELTADEVRADHRQLYLTDRERRTLAAKAEFDAWAAAGSITDAVNNTSLVFVLEVDDVKLFFPGDAQWGLWDAILARPHVADLLRDTTVYKVGHHGSHNASHRRFVDELMGTTTASMMSFHPVDSWPSIPNLKLVAALDKGKRALVRSDQTMRPPHTHRDGTIASEYSIDLQ